MSLHSRAGALALALSMLVAGPAGAATNTQRARVAVHWLSHEQSPDGSFPGFSPIGSTADAIVAMAAAKRSPEDIAEALAYLQDNQGDIDSIGEIAKVVMAVEAAGGDVRDFGGRDLVQEIRNSRQPDGRFGATTEVFNHALAMVALTAAGESLSDPEIEWLLAAQCEDGGWQFDAPAGPGDDAHCYDGTPTDYFGSDTDTTAYAVIALSSNLSWGSTPPNPFRFFKTRRDPVKNGWGYDLQYPLTNSNSTALVIEAYRSNFRDVPDGAFRALKRLQYKLCGARAGAFAFTYERETKSDPYKKGPPDVGASIGAILGLVDRPYDAVSVSQGPPEPADC